MSTPGPDPAAGPEPRPPTDRQSGAGAGFRSGPSARRWRRITAGVAGGAALIAAVTVVARVVGFGRWLVFADTVQASCLGTAYSSANMLPNIVFEVVAGGALSSAVVPVVGAQLARGDVDDLRQTTSALLSWAVVVLLPLAVLCALAAGPLMRWLVAAPAGCDAGAAQDTATRMFVVFASQIPMYGVGVVCGGVLNAHRRYLAAAVAPLVSSAVVIATYVAFGAGYGGDRNDLTGLPDRWVITLAIGTTAGVLTLALVMLVPVLRLLTLRPTLAFPPGVATKVRSLAVAGLAVLVAQQVSVLVVVRLANGEGGSGALNLYNYAWAVYLLPYAVLAVPIATSSFTALSAHMGRGDEAAFVGTAARTTRAVVLASLLGAALLAATAVPVARMFLAEGDGVPSRQLTWALVAFAPGLLGYGLVAHLGRVLYARHAGRPAALATVAGWVVVVVATVAAVPAVERAWVVAAIGAANSLGMLVAGAALLRSLRRDAGDASLAGVPRALAAGAAAAAVASVVVALLVRPLTVEARWANGLLSVGAGLVTVLVFAGAVLVLDRDGAHALLARRSHA